MKTISEKEYEGERPLYESHDLTITNCAIHAGESAIKEGSNIIVRNCVFEGKYPFWCVNGAKISDCLFKPGARAAIWYTQNLEMTDCVVEAPKMFREIDNVKLTRVKLLDALETLWECRNVEMKECEVHKADYLLMHSSDIRIDNYRHQGNYSFQYCKNVEISNALLDTKDAFWNTENVVVRDSVITGEYLGWYSRNLRLIRCRIGGTQPLCYAENLVLEDCIFDEDADLAFEYSTVEANIIGNVPSIKNPRSGHINAGTIGQIIIDENIKQPADCVITTDK